MTIKKKTLKVHNLNLQNSKMIYAYHIDVGFDLLDFYIPTSLKPTPGAFQALLCLMYHVTIKFILPKNNNESLMKIKKPALISKFIVHIWRELNTQQL